MSMSQAGRRQLGSSRCKSQCANAIAPTHSFSSSSKILSIYSNSLVTSPFFINVMYGEYDLVVVEFGKNPH